MDVAILIAIGALFIAVVFLIVSNNKNKEPKEDKSMLLLQQQMQDLTKTLDKKIGESSQAMHDSMKTQLGESAKVLQN